MKIPGFTAEASLARGSRFARTHQSGQQPTSAGWFRPRGGWRRSAGLPAIDRIAAYSDSYSPRCPGDGRSRSITSAGMRPMRVSAEISQ
jgi:hypothetical protein